MKTVILFDMAKPPSEFFVSSCLSLYFYKEQPKKFPGFVAIATRQPALVSIFHPDETGRARSINLTTSSGRAGD
jgi:hypothetical protein